MKRAFTLIELLVVIAIIAILAAILFPVFAQAKLAAKKAVAISNAKQVTLANIMYLGDYDDTYLNKVTSWSTNANNDSWQVSFYDVVNPYMKSPDLTSSPASFINNKNTYGFTGCNPSTGFTVYNISLKPNAILIPNDGMQYDINGSGLGSSSVITPASTIMMIDTPTAKNDYLSYDWHNSMIQGTSLHPTDQVLENPIYSDAQCDGYTRNSTNVTGLSSGTAYSGQTVFTFADGHAKAMKFAAACFLPGNGGDNYFGTQSSNETSEQTISTNSYWISLVDQTYIPALNADNR